MSTIRYGLKHGRLIAVPLDWAKCGRYANYVAHLRRGEKPCDACRRANNRYQAKKRAGYAKTRAAS